MVNFRVYIISWANNDPEYAEMRDKRMKYHYRQLEWWLEYTDLPITVLAMNRKPGEEFKHSRIETYHIPNMTLQKVSNFRLELFYSSQDRWGIMLDDDVELYNDSNKNYNSAHNIFAEMSDHIEMYDVIDCFTPLNPQKRGFNKLWNDDSYLYRDNHVFKRQMDLKNTFYCLRNFRLFGTKEVFYDENYGYTVDTKFAIDLVYNGYNVMGCNNIVMNEYTYKDQSNFSATRESRHEPMRKDNARIVEEYRIQGLRLRGHIIDRTEFLHKFWTRPTTYVLPKDGNINKNELFIFSPPTR